MKILLVSDTHGNTSLMYTVHTLAEPVDAVIHLGDGCADADQARLALGVPVINVAGNCDVGCHAPRELIWECEGKKILLTHGDCYGVKSGLEKLEKRARDAGADAVLFGHSHRVTHLALPGLLMVNPGTLTHHSTIHSYAVLHVTPDSITAQLYYVS